MDLGLEQLDATKVIEYIDSIGLETTIHEFIQLLYSSQLEIRETSKRLLIKLGESSVPLVYDEYLEGKNDPILLDILVEIGSPSSKYIVPRIETTLEQVDPEIIQILGQIGDTSATEFLTILIKTTEQVTEDLRRAVIELGEAALPYLIKILYESKRGKAKEIAKMVCSIGGEPTKKLVPLIHDREFKPIWPEIIDALQHLEDPELEEIIHEYNENINELYSNKWRKRAKETKEKTFQ